MRSIRRSLAVLALLAVLPWLGVALLLAQDSTVVVPTNPGTTAWGMLAYAVLLPVVGWLSTRSYDGIKTAFPWYDRLPALVHQVAAPVWSFLLGSVAAATGAAALTDIHAINAAWIGGVLNVLLAAGIKRAEKVKAPVDATAVLEATRASGSPVVPQTHRPI